MEKDGHEVTTQPVHTCVRDREREIDRERGGSREIERNRGRERGWGRENGERDRKREK